MAADITTVLIVFRRNVLGFPRVINMAFWSCGKTEHCQLQDVFTETDINTLWYDTNYHIRFQLITVTRLNYILLHQVSPSANVNGALVLGSQESVERSRASACTSVGVCSWFVCELARLVLGRQGDGRGRSPPLGCARLFVGGFLLRLDER